MKRQFRAFIVLISCFMTMLLLSPLACWADQNVGSNEYESVPETQSDPSDQTAAVADETAPSIDATVEPKEAAPDVSYKSTFQALVGSRRLHRMARPLAQQASPVGLKHSGFPSLIRRPWYRIPLSCSK